MIHSLKKALSPTATLRDVKRAMLHCEMGKDELALLIDTVPNESDPQSQRKAEEWKEAVKSIAEFQLSQPEAALTEDEKCVMFLVAVPNLHERMQCMYITAAFGEIVGVVLQKLQQMTHCLDMLIFHKRLIVVWQGLLRVGNILNEGTSRGDQLYFRISCLRRAIDVRGNRGMTLPEYLAAFVGGVFDQQEWRVLQRARDAGLFQTYSACKDVLDTYVTILGGQSETGTSLPPMMEDSATMEGLKDMFPAKMQEFAERHLGTAKTLVECLIVFMAKYAAAATYFGDPETLLPLEKGVDGDSENEDSQARDLFLRISAFAGVLRNKLKNNRVFEEIPELAATAAADSNKTTSVAVTPRVAPAALLIKELQSLPIPNIPQSTPVLPVDDDPVVETAVVTNSVPELPTQPIFSHSEAPMATEDRVVDNPLRITAKEEVVAKPRTGAIEEETLKRGTLKSFGKPAAVESASLLPQRFVSEIPHLPHLITPLPAGRKPVSVSAVSDEEETDEVAPLPPTRPLNVAERLASQRPARTMRYEREMEDQWRVLWAAAIGGVVAKRRNG
eukprot:Gregarina_sp_Pseudo_9__5063@NODE_531_length_2632_cov_5_153490_g501_i0_p1_GENE_NODE_531_length_2632_cov_5_153490_g501_i0NODE_531_length_2632_cov_5_153490_g501_i0_p1_ORF_typecomplete_len560_score103_64FH2/PF02181_23/3_4e21DUF3323/PF11796_8/1_8e02DUF3323/PF11796_8/0_81_NODE_531_length_2632_cov_5_153490_g501_i01871866